MSRTRQIVTTGTLLAALAFPGGALAQQDLRSPDARDAARAITQSPPAEARQDLRSPDARDAAERAPVVVRVEPPADTGLSWDSVGIGALIGAGLMFSVAGAYMLIGRRRTHGPHVA
jgi:hypothetical protein